MCGGLLWLFCLKGCVVFVVLTSKDSPKAVCARGASAHQKQDTIEGRLEKRAKGVFAPPAGRRLVAFIDDLNMPAKSRFGFMPPLELLKLWADNGFWCGRAAA